MEVFKADRADKATIPRVAEQLMSSCNLSLSQDLKTSVFFSYTYYKLRTLSFVII